jgi:hypothetical protein
MKHLKSLGILSLLENNLSEGIPNFVVNIPSALRWCKEVESLNLSYNPLEGMILVSLIEL